MFHELLTGEVWRQCIVRILEFGPMFVFKVYKQNIFVMGSSFQVSALVFLRLF